MTVLYWPTELDCTEESRAIAHPETVHLHCLTDWHAARAFRSSQRVSALANPRHPPPSLLGPPVGQRYVCVRGPGGRVRDVMWSGPEVAAAINGLL